jgi:hypothetical protein
MATRLVLLCSRLLFPATAEMGAEAEREAARKVARIDALRVMRSAASWLLSHPQLGNELFAPAAARAEPPGRLRYGADGGVSDRAA